MKDKVIGFFGLGNMGMPICQGMLRSGFKIVIPNYRAARTQERAIALEELIKQGAKASSSQLEMIQKCDIFVLSLPKSQQVEEVVLAEDGIFSNAKPGTIIIDLTSADPMSTKKLSKILKEKDMAILDCPVSGGVKGAAAQTLTIMVGGEKEIFDRCRPILETIGSPEKVYHVGPSGSGDMIKCANNFLSACCSAATTEAIAVCGKAGIDPKVAIEIISNSGGMSHASKVKFPNTVFPGNKWNFSLNLMAKDVGLFNTVARELNVPAFFGNTTAQIWEIPMAEVGENEDCIHVQKTFEKWAGIDLCGIDDK